MDYSRPPLSLEQMEIRLRESYDLRVVGSTLALRRGRSGPFRREAGTLTKWVKDYLVRWGRTDCWGVGLVDKFRSYLLADAPVLNESAGEVLTNRPSETTKNLLKEL